MNYRENKNQQNLLNQFLAEHGVQLSEDVLGKLYDFADLVVNTKQFGNLISAKDSEKFLSRHIADSLVPYIYIVKGGLQDNSTPNSEFRIPNYTRYNPESSTAKRFSPTFTYCRTGSENSS